VSTTGSQHPEHHAGLGVLWGKSNAGGPVNLLLQHLLDTAAVAELMWDRFLAPVIRDKIDDCCGGRGRSLFALLCGLHDIGKASPAFQAKVLKLALAVRAAGLGWRQLHPQARNWHHTRAGAAILRRMLPAAGWSSDAVSWVWPLIAGHHGVVPNSREVVVTPRWRDAQGRDEWETVQDLLVRRVAAELDIDLGWRGGTAHHFGKAATDDAIQVVPASHGRRVLDPGAMPEGGINEAVRFAADLTLRERP
jgi:CRISPR-associated endonuclease/helicase Cas3